MKDKFLLSVVVPMYFEQDVVRECHRRLMGVLDGRYDFEIVYVNDGSTDGTLPILKELAAQDERIKVLSFSRNFGHQVAVTAGVDHASGDALVIIDADLQDPPELIPDMVKLWREGWEVVYAKRKKRKGESAFKRLTAKVFYRILGLLTDIDIPEDTGDFRLMDRKVADAFRRMPERSRFIRGMIAWLGFRQTPLEYERDARFAGETKYPLKKMLKLASNGILSFSTQPLRLVMHFGLLAVLVSLGLLLWAVVAKATGNASAGGWASLMVTVTFLGGVQLISVGVLGQYLARMFEESKCRPLYVISETVNIREKPG
jgi:glycosyltransferase involved in cell wall biosynthesis